jgi:hypothetical protein
LGWEIPSPTASRAFMNCFNNPEEDMQRGKGKAFIPLGNEHLQGFANVHFHLWEQACIIKPLTEITLDQDATFTETQKQGALYNYKGERSYEAFNTYCPEYDIMVGTQYCDGNVPPGYKQSSEFKRILAHIPACVKKVNLRSDSAAYQKDLMDYCSSTDKERFGVIDFTISAPVTPEIREAAKKVPEIEWQTLYRETKGGLEATNQEWAEIAYVSQALCTSKNAPEYRYFVTREKFEVSSKDQAELHREENQLPLPIEVAEEQEKANENLSKLHLTELSGNVYKIFAVVTNILEKEGGELIRWHRKRCGKSEEVHHILKEELAGGHVISKNIGANAAYWNVAVLALSLNNLVKQHLLPEEMKVARPKTLRFLYYGIAGRIVHHARQVILKVSERSAAWLEGARLKLIQLSVKLCESTV